jgi:hypothetical protein
MLTTGLDMDIKWKVGSSSILTIQRKMDTNTVDTTDLRKMSHIDGELFI